MLKSMHDLWCIVRLPLTQSWLYRCDFQIDYRPFFLDLAKKID